MWASGEDALPVDTVPGTLVRGKPSRAADSQVARTHGECSLLPGPCLWVPSPRGSWSPGAEWGAGFVWTPYRIKVSCMGLCRGWYDPRVVVPMTARTPRKQSRGPSSQPHTPAVPLAQACTRPSDLGRGAGPARDASVPPPARSQLLKAGSAQHPFGRACGVLTVGGPMGTVGGIPPSRQTLHFYLHMRQGHPLDI